MEMEGCASIAPPISHGNILNKNKYENRNESKIIHDLLLIQH